MPDFSTLGEKLISVVYNDGDYFPDFSFTVWVKENISSNDPVDPDPENPTVMYTSLDSISIKNLPIKTIYSLNESFDPTGLEITATYTETYSDWTSQSKNVDITYPNNMISLSEVDMTTEGTKTITLTFTENGSSLTCTFQVTVINPSVFTYSDNAVVNSNSYKKGDNITISIPAKEGENDTTVNIAKLYEQYTAISSQVGENGSVAISYGDAGKTTIEGEFLMTALVDTTATKEVEKYAKIKSFVNAISPKTQDFPKISADIGGRNLNLYHTGIVDLFNLYFENSAGDKLPDYDNMYLASSYFDALDYLNANGGIAYDANGDYTGNYYNLNVNAALLMGVPELKNVNIINTVSVADNEFQGEFTNVRFAENTSGFTFSDSAKGIGLIEFAGDAPSVLPNTDKAKIIISNTDNTNDDILLYGGAVIDFSKLSSLDDNTGPNFISGGGVYYEHAYFKNENAFNNFKSKGGAVTGAVYYTEDGTSSIPNYKTNQQWVNAANANNGAGDFVQGNGNVFFPSPAISKLNLDEKNNNNKLLNTILYNNQKVYNS